jgi:CDP-glucose 4,6-dehydratase
VLGALEDYETVLRAINEHEADTVLHLGAQPIVGIANRNPRSTFEANIRGSWNVLDACRELRGQVKRIVVASSDKAYGTAPALPYDESMPLNGRHPYDASKSCTDILPRPTTRPMACRCASRGRELLRRAGSQLQPHRARRRALGDPGRAAGAAFRRIDDPRLHLCARRGAGLSHPRRGDGGARPARPGLQLLDRAADLRARPHAPNPRRRGRPDIEPIVLGQASNEIPEQHLSAAKARARLGWAPAFTLDAALAETIDWYRGWMVAEDAAA